MNKKSSRNKKKRGKINPILIRIEHHLPLYNDYFTMIFLHTIDPCPRVYNPSVWLNYTSVNSKLGLKFKLYIFQQIIHVNYTRQVQQRPNVSTVITLMNYVRKLLLAKGEKEAVVVSRVCQS